jgi:hypothetical protein
MRKVWFTALVLLSLLALITGTVSAAPHAGGLITLVDVRNDANGNVIFVFNVSGDFAKPRMNGSVQVQGEDANYGMHCSSVSEGTVHCTTSRKAGGRNVVVYLEGFVFWAFVPARGFVPGNAGSTEYCYGLYDIVIDFDREEANWQETSSHCQDVPANVGDELEAGEFLYEFLNGSPSFCWVSPLETEGYFNQCPF